MNPSAYSTAFACAVSAIGTLNPLVDQSMSGAAPAPTGIMAHSQKVQEMFSNLATSSMAEDIKTEPIKAYPCPWLKFGYAISNWS